MPLQLLFRSRANRPREDGDLDIYIAAQSRNERVGISGALVRLDEGYVQVLEGPENVVRNTLQRISEDPRHHNLEVLLERPIEIPEFEGWGAFYLPLADECFDEFTRREPEELIDSLKDKFDQKQNLLSDAAWRASLKLPS